VNGPEIHLAGGVWPVANPGSLPGRGQTPWELAAVCLDRSAAVFASHGVTREQMFEHDGPAAAIVAACGGGSREAVALSLWTMARNGQSVLSMASRGDAPSPATMAEAVAGVFANIGMLRLILDSMEPKGIAARAVAGGKTAAGSANAIPARQRQAEQDVMDRYGRLALEFAQTERQSEPNVTRAEIIRRLRISWPDMTARTSLPSDRSVSDFLRRKGIL
jgi:hypothetical protein